eukprot:CAMPEP_0204594736 /NCGR_PEP_ID=MMETSP0661-20131031/52256_1 /ASSEMBLY_ACC=CAM_ASM_000606 /TAXON_ID=109239 /ORGANISM="Alexandrium margalefi, Strain AMGDE01CS-322" /LENGTH=50 /DNA_ID=CAMNT_0051605169 /DNA_START=53 /DNA_END=203 /DNA_ORIENTATION=-
MAAPEGSEGRPHREKSRDGGAWRHPAAPAADGSFADDDEEDRWRARAPRP